MTGIPLHLILPSAAMAICAGSSAAPGLIPTDLRSEYLRNPLGLDVMRPRLSWVLTQADAKDRGQRQTAYQVLVASGRKKLVPGKADLWDSGKVESDQSVHVVYAGKPLRSRMACYWKVRVWDKDGRPSAWSKPAMWTMGLLAKADWGAKRITDDASATKSVLSNGYQSRPTSSRDTSKWVAVDLGERQLADAVRLFPARPSDWGVDAPGFLFPLRFRVEVSDRADFADARTVVDRTAADEPNPGTEAPIYRFEPTGVRYVRLTVTRLAGRRRGSYGFALAEMQVLSGEKNLAEGAVVTALDSVEERGWSMEKLVDGRTEPWPVGAQPALMLRKAFPVASPVKRATVFVTARGVYELHINGERVGDHILAPEWTDCRDRIQYQTYDVTKLVKQGENAIGATLGDGWCLGRIGLWASSGREVRYPELLLRLEIELADGRTEAIVSDESWRSTSAGPIISSDIYDGETYDARKEMPGWDRPSFDESSWAPVRASAELGAQEIVWQRNEPIRVTKELKPVEMTEPKPGVYVFDMGQNMVGWCRLKLSAPAGTTVTIRHAEMMNDDGTVYTTNLRSAAQTDHYTCRGGGVETYQPHFTYHGFRYVELTGLPAKPAADSVLGQVFHSSSPDAGRFECSDRMLNQLMDSIVWTQRANLESTPTDCPQRNERLGWLGDINSFAQTAIFNMDMAAFFSKWVRDVRDAQADDGRYPDIAPNPGARNAGGGAPAWADAGTVVPWRMYQNYADKRLLEEHFESAKRWVDFVHKNNPNLLWQNARGADFNDWLNGDTLVYEGWPKTGASVPNEVFATAFFAHSTWIISQMARVIGRTEEADSYGRLAEDIKAAFNKAFVKPDGRIEGDTQAGYALALGLDLLPEEVRPEAARHMVEAFTRYNGHMSTGFLSTHRLMLELTRMGYNDEAYRLVELRTFPSWGFMIENGATTIWERWDGYVKGRGFQDPGMNSFNHWAFGSVGEWMWRSIVGINPDDANPGYKRFIIHPRPGGGLTWAKGEYNSIRGKIVSDWRIEKGKLTLKVSVPTNTTALVYVPAESAAAVTESGKPAGKADGVRFLRMEDGCAVFEVGGGRYSFVSGT